MLDMFNVPVKNLSTLKIFNPNGSSNLNGLQAWNKPRGVSMVMMIAIAGGGGGGGGFTRATTADGGGGAGGACSGISRFVCPAIFLPETLYIQVGAGGQGGAASVAGTAGLNSFILTSKTAVLPNIILYSGVNAPGGGAAGAGSGSAVGGTVPTIAVTQPTNVWGAWFATVGIVGATGGVATGGAGTSVTAWGTIPLSPGAGGGGDTGANNSGGAQTASALLDCGSQGYFPTAAGGIAPAGTTGAAINGSSGIIRLTPFFNSGGAGGGTNDTGQAGHGGHGGYGCGGGGGGAGAVGGRGGNGGDGLVLIAGW